MNLKLSDKKIVRIAGFAYLLAILILTFAFIISITYHIPFKKITGDPALTFHANPLTGVISNIGILLWCVTASVCLFSAVLLRFSNRKNESAFLGFSGLITCILLIDDFFMVHDYIFYSIGLHQHVMYTIYLVIFVFYFLYFKTQILRSQNLLLLVLAFLFLGSSLVMDLFIKRDGIAYFIEDTLKFLGIMSWFLYYTTYSFFAVRNN